MTEPRPAIIRLEAYHRPGEPALPDDTRAGWLKYGDQVITWMCPVPAEQWAALEAALAPPAMTRASLDPTAIAAVLAEHRDQVTGANWTIWSSCSCGQWTKKWGNLTVQEVAAEHRLHVAQAIVEATRPATEDDIDPQMLVNNPDCPAHGRVSE